MRHEITRSKYYFMTSNSTKNLKHSLAYLYQFSATLRHQPNLLGNSPWL